MPEANRRLGGGPLWEGRDLGGQPERFDPAILHARRWQLAALLRWRQGTKGPGPLKEGHQARKVHLGPPIPVTLIYPPERPKPAMVQRGPADRTCSWSVASVEIFDRSPIDEAVAFYSKLLGAHPAKRRPGYTNFAIAEPPLKLVLLQHPGQGGSLNHLGVEVDGISAVDAEQTRLAAAGLDLADERGTTCCYAKQDKFWVKDAPDGESWEFYTVLEDSATFYGQDDSQACCGGPAGSSAGTSCC